MDEEATLDWLLARAHETGLLRASVRLAQVRPTGGFPKSVKNGHTIWMRPRRSSASAISRTCYR